MFYTERVLFVHIPRTGGTWLTEWAHEMLGASLDVHYLKHSTLDDIYRVMPFMEKLEPFTIVRDHAEIMESYWKLACAATDYSRCTNEWAEESRRLRSMTLQEYKQCGDTILSYPYYTIPVREFPYQNPHVDVCRWLLHAHGCDP